MNIGQVLACVFGVVLGVCSTVLIVIGMLEYRGRAKVREMVGKKGWEA